MKQVRRKTYKIIDIDKNSADRFCQAVIFSKSVLLVFFSFWLMASFSARRNLELVFEPGGEEEVSATLEPLPRGWLHFLSEKNKHLTSRHAFDHIETRGLGSISCAKTKTHHFWLSHVAGSRRTFYFLSHYLSMIDSLSHLRPYKRDWQRKVGCVT